MNKERDLRLVFASIPTSGLRSLWDALENDRVIRGRFVDSHGNGCLFYWLSEREMVDRPSRLAWTRSNPFFQEQHDAAIRRLIVGWDNAEPETLVKGAGYEQEYPQPSYTLTRHDVRRALVAVMRERSEANRLERSAQQRATRKSWGACAI